uniref:RNA ligase 1 n=1 Tax=Doryrhamphus excisus TaxID=161450 RepID=UPI0025AEB30D|nr:RNA ligase 1 [Doryrhamphus excisus]
MRRLCSVQQKVSCVFMTEVKEEPSRKRDCQPFHVVATAIVNPAVLEADINCALATEKLDGTCCYVTLYKGKPQLWARLDRKPNKQAEKRFKKYQYSLRSSKGFIWNVKEDFKTVPDTWIPAHRVIHHNGHPIPDEYGHIPGWVPVEDDNKQYCWHSSVVDNSVGSALVLRPVLNNEDTLEIAAVPLADLLEQTLELIGTNVNGNPYGLGSKKQPIHFLVSHGSLCIRNPPPVDFQQLYSWFRGGSEGLIEGIVWHCADGSLFKVHRHHMGLEWPAEGTHLGDKSVVVRIDGATVDDSKSLFASLSRLNGHCFSRLQDVHFDL